MPTHLIDAFKSIITDKIFCKGDRKKEQVLDIMDSKGIILKKDVDQIWRNGKYSKFRKEKDYRYNCIFHIKDYGYISLMKGRRLKISCII
jgi:hypothetical protein